jgi:hypothetical protein
MPSPAPKTSGRGADGTNCVTRDSWSSTGNGQPRT